MAIFKKKALAEAATASVADDSNRHSSDDVAMQISALEQHIENDDPAAKALAELGDFRMTPGAKSLLDRALDNVANNDGSGLEDPEAAFSIKLRSGLLEATGNDLSIALVAILDSSKDAKSASRMVYSLCYNVLKAAGFIANLDYRRYLDPKADFDLWAIYGKQSQPDTKGEDGRDNQEDSGEFASDRREEEPSAPLGLLNTVDAQWEWLQDTYGANIEDEGDVILRALSDVQLFLNLTAESVGWQGDKPMPFVQMMNPDGTFDAIYDAKTALDEFEIRRKLSLKRRRDNENTTLLAAQAKARELLLKAVARQ